MSVAVRTDVRPGDVGAVVRLHGLLYAREHGFDVTFEGYVARSVADFAIRGSARERLWLAEEDGRLVGCIGIVDAGDGVAQLRWFLVDPSQRGRGLGRRLVGDAVAFARGLGCSSIVLWTVSSLSAAARLYREAGFVKSEEKPGRHWGADVVEEKHVLALG